MQMSEKLYPDIDYESFPVADLDLDLHWIQLPNSRCQTKLEALQRDRIAALPKDHKVILIPTEELWPLVNHTVQQCLRPHPELRATINAAVAQAVAEHRGWSNPFPRRPRLLNPTEIPGPRKIKNRDTNPAISFKTFISNLGKRGPNPTPAKPAKVSTDRSLTIESVPPRGRSRSVS